MQSFEKQSGLPSSSLPGGNMSNVGRNQEVVKKFLASKAFDFAAFGKFVAENGASLASSEDGEFGFVIGHHVIRYCIPPVTVVNEGVNPAELRDEVAGD
jgi:hypothetical protein